MVNKLVVGSIFLFLLLSAAGANAQAATPAATDQDSATTLACVRTAVEKRENTIIAAIDTFHTSVKSAFETRKSALLAAWQIADRSQRKTAINAAWKTYQDSVKNARKAFKDARKASWAQFATERKACKAPATGENPASELTL